MVPVRCIREEKERYQMLLGFQRLYSLDHWHISQHEMQ